MARVSPAVGTVAVAGTVRTALAFTAGAPPLRSATANTPWDAPQLTEAAETVSPAVPLFAAVAVRVSEVAVGFEAVTEELAVVVAEE
jgi:hypothetical protein